MTEPSALPIIAIVGRPNVGKSRLFNRYAGHRRALVQDLPGVTRDRIAEEISLLGRRVLLVDTAGLDSDQSTGLDAQVQSQARAAVKQADAILFVVDAQAGSPGRQAAGAHRPAALPDQHPGRWNSDLPPTPYCADACRLEGRRR